MQLGTKLGVNIQEKEIPNKDCLMETCAEWAALGKAKGTFG